MDITENLFLLKRSVPDHVGIVAVSKTQPVSAILQAYHAGQQLFGENKVQELVYKQAQLPSEIEWHFIGHLQTNKVRYIGSFIRLIHSVDSIKLLIQINKEARNNNRVIDCLLQFHIASETSKFGLDISEAVQLLESESYRDMQNIRITGVMGMGSFSVDTQIVRREFKSLHDYYHLLKKDYFNNQDAFKVISMGMSGDYRIAIEEGSTLIRVGSAIFGERQF